MMDGLHDASFWVMIAFIFVFLMLFNKVVPNLHLRFREVWPGALFSLVGVDSGLAWIFVRMWTIWRGIPCCMALWRRLSY